MSKTVTMLLRSVNKVLTAVIAALVCSITIVRIGRRFFQWISAVTFTVIAACILLLALLYAIMWIRKREIADEPSPASIFFQAVTRYMIAIDLILFGLQKFFGLQFSMPLAMLDLPFSSFSGEDLTFAYFARSFAFVIIIGSLQIIGSLLLLFSRTRLLGVFTLLPVMINIVLLNICYKMEAGELAHSSILLTGLVNLLSFDHKRLKDCFLCARHTRPFASFDNAWRKNLVRFSAVAIPSFLIWSYRMPEKHPAVYGKYAVSRLSVNQRQLLPSCKDSILTLVYLDQNADCIFEYNSQQRRLIGNYQLDETTGRLVVAWRYPDSVHDTLFAHVSSLSSDEPLTLSGKMGNQTLDMVLQKVKPQ